MSPDNTELSKDLDRITRETLSKAFTPLSKATELRNKIQETRASLQDLGVLQRRKEMRPLYAQEGELHHRQAATESKNPDEAGHHEKTADAFANLLEAHRSGDEAAQKKYKRQAAVNSAQSTKPYVNAGLA